MSVLNLDKIRHQGRQWCLNVQKFTSVLIAVYLFLSLILFFCMLRPSLENPTDLGKEVSDPVGSPPNFKAVLDTYFSQKKGGCHENIAHSLPFFFFTRHPASFLFLLFVFFFGV